MKPEFDITVLIVAYKNRDTIRRCLAALEQQTCAPARVKLLENGSPGEERLVADELPDWVEFVSSEENLGFAGGNNLLAQDVETDWLVLLNPDAFPHSDWISALKAATTRFPEVRLFGSTQFAADQSGVLDGCGDVYHGFGLAYRSGYGKRWPSPPPTGEVFGPCGAALLIRRETWQALGGFDDAFFCYNEDVDLAYRARLQGWPTIQLAEAQIDHLGYGSSGRRSEFATFHGVRNRLWVFLRNTPGWALPLLAPLHAAITLALWLSAARFGHFKLFGKALGAALKEWPRIMRERRALQANRKVKVSEILSAMTWSPFALLTRAADVRASKER